jgi:cytochrome c peroxidase
VAVGERLFLETRFAQYFFAHSKGDANAVLAEGDPVVTTTVTTGQALPGPFRAFAINCRSCHLVGEQFADGRGNRTYADYARRSPVPARADGRRFTVRNSPAMVNATIPRERDLLLHLDGEFATGEDLVKATLTGRNLGWLPQEYAAAVGHIARIIREDDGRGPLAREFGGYSYRHVLAGADEELGEEGERFRLPAEYRLEVANATDQQILDAIARLITAYMDSLFFSRDENWEYDGSPYDAFLETNRLPRKADPGQSELYYNRNLLAMLNDLKAPIYVFGTNGVVPPAPGRFKTLPQTFRFGTQELAGMKIFFTRTNGATDLQRRTAGGIGNCISCHLAPNFTDFSFHNTGVAQEEYDLIHGARAFAKLAVPDLEERNRRFDLFLPPTANHPHAAGPFLQIPTLANPGHTDLGLWNVFGNPDQPGVQPALRRLLVGEGKTEVDAVLLPRTVALFKTPGLRGLAFSDPYLHNGSKDTIEEVIDFYRNMSHLARAGKVRNAAPELSAIFLKEEDVAPLAAFLRSLNEDYE